ncbi:hypothetical protein B0H66DRAFT_526845 [Apodospora peruviana]|uniref:Uncharacterized protein n=1 Tax=Apodospora peruviana TaxID=516989 RepID=A0AAE0IQG2_9PEZI|nr:hypothetical protein B0H66DRAFT_526845 [Apodospora peruviana]
MRLQFLLPPLIAAFSLGNSLLVSASPVACPDLKRDAILKGELPKEACCSYGKCLGDVVPETCISTAQDDQDHGTKKEMIRCIAGQDLRDMGLFQRGMRVDGFLFQLSISIYPKHVSISITAPSHPSSLLVFSFIHFFPWNQVREMVDVSKYENPSSRGNINKKVGPPQATTPTYRPQNS